MRILSLNIRGIRRAPKLSSLYRLVQIGLSDILLVQETMVDVVQARNVFSKLFPCWKCHSKDALGQFGGLYVALNPSKVDFSPFMIHVGLLLEGLIIEGNHPDKILNCYGPYNDRRFFWDQIVASGMLGDKDLIIGG